MNGGRANCASGGSNGSGGSGSGSATTNIGGSTGNGGSGGGIMINLGSINKWCSQNRRTTLNGKSGKAFFTFYYVLLFDDEVTLNLVYEH